MAPPCFLEPLEPRALLAASITGLTLINADTDQPVAGYTGLASGVTLDLSKIGTSRLNVRADVGAGTGSVRFAYDANANFRTENVAPFALAGDSGSGNFYSWTPTAGSHILKATPFSGTNAGGAAGIAKTITFTVMNGPAAAPAVSATKVSATSMQVNWSAPPPDQQVAKYVVTYTPGAWAPGGAGTAGQTLTKRVLAPATRVTLSGLLPFTLYSIDVTAVSPSGKTVTTHLNKWTAAPATDRRFLYVVRLPKNRQGFTKLTPHVEVFDVADGHKWVKNIPLPSGIYGSRGIAANVATQKLFIGFFNTPADTYQTGGLLCVDLRTDKVLWLRRYTAAEVPSPDRFDITPDGQKIYMPVGEHGTDNFWRVLNASNGDVIGTIRHVTAPHNTIVSVDGKLAFLEGQEKGTQPAAWKHTVAVVDTATNTVIKRVGPFRDVVRPFTINGKGSLIFATVNNFVGFQVASVATGKILYTAAPTNYVQPTTLAGSASHGIALTPDEKYVFVVDGLKVGVHAWDVSQINSRAPRYLGFIKTRARGQNLAGQPDPNASQDTNGVPAWLAVSWDGRYLYPESGEIIDVATRKVIGQLRAKTTNSAGQLVDAPYTHSRFMVEIDVDATGKIVRATDQFGIGLVR